MLNAILNSKAGRLHSEDEQSIRWKELFNSSEDLVTATVIERLSYLPAKVAWSLLVEASSGQLPAYRIAEITGLEFWPMWSAEGRIRGVEPDVYITLELGDPVRRVEVIIEAKHWGQQYGAQWEAEISAWAELASGDRHDLPEHLILLAIGGNPDRHAQEVRRASFIQSIRKRHPQLPELSLAMLGWQDIARACATYRTEERHEQRLMADIKSGLELCGHFYQVRPRQLEQLGTRRLCATTLPRLTTANIYAQQRIMMK